MIPGDHARLQGLIAKLLRIARGDLAGELRKRVAEQTRAEIDTAFRERRSPDGRSWKRTKQGNAPLVHSGALRAGFDVAATKDGVRVTNRVPYAAVHQHGARIRRRRRGQARKARFLGARSGALPARPMLPTSRWGPGPTTRLRAVASRLVHTFLSG